ncbi:HepT-like ribonuclease domain-containing protein [Desulfitobacterium hafniense]|uniref:HepT-like ribonuclease domain-containing protein n=1 Tax=Desulfitobacterium hafniense TaxID=49338 RepID=UPI00035EC6F8|nr:HepT-like ribonuclease domain-containing protein [Desulfitobacterium hafniense]
MKDDKVFLHNILESIIKIETYTNSGKDDFMTSEIIQDAVIRNLEIIGEATKRVSQGLKEQTPEIPWRQMAKIVWNVVQNEVPQLKIKIMELLD